MKKVELAFLLCGVCANALYLLGNDLFALGYILLAVFLWFGTAAIHLAVHELGHLVGGLMSGYSLVFFSVGGVRLSYRKKKKISISIGKSRGGQCVMEPRKPEKRRYLLYNLGGAAANLLLTLAAGALLLIGLHSTNLLFINLAVVGMQKIVINCIPRIANGVPNDAYVIKLLSRNPYTQKDYCMYLKLFAAYYRENPVDSSDYMYDRPLDVAENELLYYREMQSILEETEKVATG